MNFEDPEDYGNSTEFHTGKRCIEGCGRPAGTYWSRFWCFECNVKRMRRVGGEIEQLCLDFKKEA